ncbi:MAG: ArsA family ATPase [Actinomycetota bacterium]
MLLSRARLVVVTGKGGVGRSTTAAAIARLERSRGRRVLAVDASPSVGLGLALGNPLPPGEMVAIDTDLSALRLTPEAALDEYVKMTLRAPVSPRSLGPVARIFDFVATAAPAVREILTIGKIGHEVRRGPWDTVVVDGPATGHIVELLDAPAALGELVGIGPLAAESAWLTELLHDDEQTEVVVVTTPEELPVNETLELVARLGQRTSVTVSTIVVNRMVAALGDAARDEERRLADTDSPVATLARVAVARAERAIEEAGRLAALELPIITVPEDDDPVAASAEVLATHWRAT